MPVVVQAKQPVNNCLQLGSHGDIHVQFADVEHNLPEMAAETEAVEHNLPEMAAVEAVEHNLPEMVAAVPLLPVESVPQLVAAAGFVQLNHHSFGDAESFVAGVVGLVVEVEAADLA